MKILVISPHSDDAELGCGGYIAKCVDRGDTVFVITVLIKNDLTPLKGVVMARNRRNEFLNGMACLGVEKANVFIALFEEDHQFDLCLYPKTKMVRYLDDLINSIRPNDIFLPMSSHHQEHEWVHQVSLAATRPSVKSTIKNVYAYEYPASGWSSNAGHLGMTGRVFTDITGYMEKKRTAVIMHSSQNISDSDGLVSVAGIYDLAKWRGREMGVRYAEMFYLLRGKI